MARAARIAPSAPGSDGVKNMKDTPTQDDPTAAPWLHLMGVPRWQVGDNPPTPLPRKDAALLAKLALDGPQPRLALCELLWPASKPAQAADSLRQRASRLHAAAGIPLVDVGATVALHRGFAVDVLQLPTLPDDVLLSTSGLLAGVDLGDHDELDRWLGKARTMVAERCAQLLTDRAEALERERRLHEAIRLARRIVELLPLAEQGWRRLMRLHYLRDDRAAAQDTYWRLHALLRDELGARPSAETQQLFQTIETAEAAVNMSRRPVPVSLLRPPVVVGRRAPWSAMVAAWQVPQPFLLVGDAGLGKSRLLEAFVQDHEGLVSDSARPGEHASADALLGRLLLQIEQRFAPDCSPALRAELARVRTEFGAPPRANANLAVLRHAIETWLVAALAHGLRAIVVDDLHNSDPSSLETLRWLAASPAMATLRFGFASRPWSSEGTGSHLNTWLIESHRPVRIDLQPLTQPELSELLVSLALPAMVDGHLTAQLYRRAGGHPLYTLATLQHAVASGADLGGPEALSIPESVQALLDARVRNLPANVRDLIQVAAVGGADLAVDRAARLLDCAPLALSESWAILEANNVLRGEAFSHDLVYEAALRAVPLGVRQSLHRQWASVLQDEGKVPSARVARHWEEGKRWLAAGRAWHAAGEAARLAGHLGEQTELFERAARCHAEAGDRSARFESLLARLDGLQLRHGGAAVLEAMPEVEALAETSLQRLRCHVARTEALLEQGRATEAVTAGTRALDGVSLHERFAIQVHAQLAIALAQSHRPEEALRHAHQAVDAARANGLPGEMVKAANALMFVHWSAGRLVDAVAAQREELAAAEALGDRAVAAASEGTMAALLAAAGDLSGTYAHAVNARARQRDCGLADNSSQLVLNYTVLGAAAAALGHYDEGLESLRKAVELSGADTVPDARAKARLTLAGVWLVLGRPDRAREAIGELLGDISPGMQMQSAWLIARAAELDGSPAERHWVRFDRLATANADLPLVQGVVFEASYREPAPLAIERLSRARADCASRGLHGTARALMWRELVRRLELPGVSETAAALACANELEAHADDGLSAKCYPPETWHTLARANERAGNAQGQSACLERGRRWLAFAMARLAPELRHAFASRNPVNRLLLSEDGPK